jgi:hypothetical protein
MVFRTVGENIRAATRMTSEPKNLITQYARTELRKAGNGTLEQPTNRAKKCH